MVYPKDPKLAIAGRATKRAAERAVRSIHANGGTEIGRWLTLAGQLLSSRPDAIRHALLFTDGQNNEPRQELDRVLDRWSGEFACDARGIGSDYLATEVIRIVSALDGQADAIAAFGDLEAEMRAIMDAAMRKQVASVQLQIRPMTGSALRFLKQTYPTRVDLTERLSAGDGAQVLDTGAWGQERREYHLCLDIEPPAQISGRPSVAARVAVTTSEPAETASAEAQAKVMVHWTQDAALSLPMDPSVAHTMDQAEMGQAIDAGCAAVRRGDRPTAERHLGRAVQLAEQSGDSESRQRLEQLVVIEDAADGKVRLKSRIDEIDLIRTEMQTVRSSMFSMSAPQPELSTPDVPHPQEAPAEPIQPIQTTQTTQTTDGPSIICTHCGGDNEPGADFCENCSQSLREAR